MGNWKLGIGNWALVIENEKSTLPITHSPLPITHSPLPITHYPLPITPLKRLLSVIRPQSNQSDNFQSQDLLTFGHRCDPNFDVLYLHQAR